jgi:hypothetical protein
VAAVVFIVNVGHIVSDHKFVRGAAEIHAAPVVVAGFDVGFSVIGGAVIFAVENIDRSPQKVLEIGFKPRARTQEDAGKAVRHERSVVIGAESPHGVTAEDDTVSVNIDPLFHSFDDSVDVLHRTGIVPPLAVFGIGGVRGDGDKGGIFDQRGKTSAFGIEVHLERGFGRGIFIPAVHKEKERERLFGGIIFRDIEKYRIFRIFFKKERLLNAGGIMRKFFCHDSKLFQVLYIERPLIYT